MNTAHLTTDVRDVALLVGELNDLMQLDHDAVAAYTVAVTELDDPGYRDAVRGFKADHERHIDQLTGLVRGYGGVPLPMPHHAGVFKLAVQGAVAAGNDAALISAFKANEVQSRDKYRRAASRQHPPDVQSVVIRAARDEQRHFDWAMRTLSELGVSTDGIADVVEQMQARSADAVAAVERGAGPLRLAVAGLAIAAVALGTKRILRND